MSPEQLERVRTVLAAAVQVPPAERPAFLASECSGDQVLLAEVEALLEVHDSAGDFLSQSLPDLLGTRGEAKSELAAGMLIKGRYRIQRRIAQSSFATVYLASDELLANMQVVVKRLDQLPDVAALQEMFASEVHALSRVRHPNVVGISDAGTLDDGIPFLVLQYVPGITLRELLRAGPVPVYRARAILRGIGMALSAAHKADVWHLDLKPENIIVTDLESDDERITLIDFGIARLKNAPETALKAGSPNYMAPEQFDNPSARCDIYSLSLIAFELFAGHLPTNTQSLADQLPRDLGKTTILALIAGQQADPSERLSQVSQFLDGLRDERKKNIAGTLSAVAGALIIAIAAYLWVTHRDVPQAYTKPIPVVSTPAREHHPVFSPDGSEIYYAVGPDGRQDIYKKALAGGDPVLVVGDPADDARPRVSPDGKQITFVRNDGHKPDLILKRLADGKEEVLAADIDMDTHSWTPDGRRLVLSGMRDGGSQALRVLEIASRKIVTLEIHDASDCGQFHPRVSPDGRTLAFTCRWFQGSDDLFTVQIDPEVKRIGRARRVTRTRDRIDSLEWAPDSLSLFYVGGPLGKGSVFRVFPNEPGGLSQLPEMPSQIESIAIPLRSWQIAFAHHLSDANVWRYDSTLATPPQLVAASSYEDEEASISPDGRRLLFESDRSGRSQIWVADADGKDAKQLTKFETVDSVGGLWAPNSKEAIVSARSKDEGERIYRISTEGPSSLTPVLQGAMAASSSRDGRWLYIVKSDGAKRAIFRTQYPEAKTTEMIAEGGAYGVESFDGRFFYFAKRDEHQGIWRQSLTGGPPTRVVSEVHRRDLFTVGKKGIFFIAPTREAQFPSLFFQSFQLSSAKKLFSFEQGIGWGLDLSPDERTLLLTQFDISNTDVMLIERFH